ncbi:MAG: RagB/SusD family nutrient uptake outer membrane protein [Mangrovibacterium sp.]
MNITDAGFSYPVQDLVDAFPMLNGKDIHEADSGYDPQNPYANKDPRLEATIVTNGSTEHKNVSYTHISQRYYCKSEFATE